MKTLIIDGNNLIHRTFWTAKNQAKRLNEQEEISNLHIYFTLNAIFSYVTKFNPAKTIIVWDEKAEYHKNVRKEEFDSYKANRSKDQTPHGNNKEIKRILGYLGINSIFSKKLEADDIIAYICRETEGQKTVVSVDKDFIQLIDNDVVLFDPIRKTEFNLANLFELTGATSIKEWLIIKCIAGDRSDNVPGIPKFGIKRINKYLQGEILLSEEEKQIYDRNLSIFKLDKYKDYNCEQEYYNTQLQVPLTLNWSLFLEECEERKFSMLLKRKDAWYSTFFLKNKLSSIFS